METPPPRSLIPRERHFFALFREDADNMRAAVILLDEMLRSNTDFQEYGNRLKDLEHLGDDITHKIVRELNTSFVTPFDREDIFGLAAKLDDVLDLVEETADTIYLDGITSVTPEAREMGTILTKIADALVSAIEELETRVNMSKHVVRIHELENEGDRVTRSAISDLFRTSSDAMFVIKWKDIYALLEKTVDTAEDIAKILENVTIKNQR